jgi:hypothetical protein
MGLWPGHPLQLTQLEGYGWSGRRARAVASSKLRHKRATRRGHGGAQTRRAFTGSTSKGDPGPVDRRPPIPYTSRGARATTARPSLLVFDFDYRRWVRDRLPHRGASGQPHQFARRLRLLATPTDIRSSELHALPSPPAVGRRIVARHRLHIADSWGGPPDIRRSPAGEAPDNAHLAAGRRFPRKSAKVPMSDGSGPGWTHPVSMPVTSGLHRARIRRVPPVSSGDLWVPE